MSNIDIKINRKVIDSKEKLDELYKGSALTFTGVDDSEESINAMIKWLKQYTDVSDPFTINVIKGETMNREYGLTGNNAYPNDLNFISIKLEDIKEVNKIVLTRLQVGGRWFDDIVDNNRVRHNEIDGIDDEEEM